MVLPSMNWPYFASWISLDYFVIQQEGITAPESGNLVQFFTANSEETVDDTM